VSCSKRAICHGVTHSLLGQAIELRLTFRTCDQRGNYQRETYELSDEVIGLPDQANGLALEIGTGSQCGNRKKGTHELLDLAMALLLALGTYSKRGNHQGETYSLSDQAIGTS
jgi:hypothetical protein